VGVDVVEVEGSAPEELSITAVHDGPEFAAKMGRSRRINKRSRSFKFPQH
jgi:hypothetical protein